MKDLAKLMPSRRVHGTRLDSELEPPPPDFHDHKPETGLSLPFLLLCVPALVVIGMLMIFAMLIYAVDKLVLARIAEKMRGDGDYPYVG